MLDVTVLVCTPLMMVMIMLCQVEHFETVKM